MEQAIAISTEILEISEHVEDLLEQEVDLAEDSEEDINSSTEQGNGNPTENNSNQVRNTKHCDCMFQSPDPLLLRQSRRGFLLVVHPLSPPLLPRLVRVLLLVIHSHDMLKNFSFCGTILLS